MHSLGFCYVKYTKGYVDGHEREDVVKDRRLFLEKMKILESTHLPPPPCSDGVHPYTIGTNNASRHLVTIYHDESAFHANEGRTSGWTVKGKQPLLPKGKGRGLMVSDFIEEHGGFLQLTDEEVEDAKRIYSNPNFPQYGRDILHIRAENEGYWTCELFVKHVKKVAKIASYKYPVDRFSILWIFDQSSNHRVYSDDALVASRMNVNDGGKQPKMRTTTWNGREQFMVNRMGQAKGLRTVLIERGVTAATDMTKKEMMDILGKHEDFKNEKSKIKRILQALGHRVPFLPKFHPELNPIERVWGKAKVYAKDKCDYTFNGLRNVIIPAFNSVSTDDIRKFFRKSREYAHAYREGYTALEADSKIKEYKSHRRVPETGSR